VTPGRAGQLITYAGDMEWVHLSAMALDLIAELEALIESFESGASSTRYVPGEQLAVAIQAARAAGFDIPARKLVFGLRTGTPREMQRVSKLDPETNELMSLDLIVVGPGLEEVWNGRLLVPWREHDVAIVSRAGLVTMKRLAGRPQDLADIAALEEADDNDET
jgi:hypothetical protein